MDTLKKLPIGLQDFKDLVTGAYLYVDKTRYLYELIDSTKFCFISRPRRFGKSLTIYTLAHLFRGEKDLFKDTWIYNRWKWEEHPVIQINLLEISAETPEQLAEGLYRQVLKNARNYEVSLSSQDYRYGFQELIEKLGTRNRVAVFVDEYEKPILDNVANPAKAEALRMVLRDFYTSIKAMDPYLTFAMLTGITKFTKAGVFSALNNLRDISINEQFAPMLGYTQEELELYFAPYIRRAAQKLEMGEADLLDKLKDHYNGFSFDGTTFVYNPYSILNFFQDLSFKNYWYDSGSPSFLHEYVKKHSVEYEELVATPLSEAEFTSREIEATSPRVFFTQTGYLTFKGRLHLPGRDSWDYILDYPNKEVSESFSRLILDSYPP